MRYVTFSLPGTTTLRIGAVQNDRIVDVAEALRGGWNSAPPDSMLALIDAGPDAWRRAAALLAPALAAAGAGQPRLEDVRLHAPIPRPRKNIFCLGQNYLNHAKEAARARERELKIPTVPIFFTKTPTTVTGPYDDVPWDPSVTEQLDYEAELGVIIGVTAKNVARERALDTVFGYTIINDVSARDLQKGHVQWFKGKSLDGFCPTGPVVVTADEFGDPQNKRIALRLNGDTRQDATTGDMIFSVAVCIESLCKGMTLEPGDIIASGTPEGVGLGRTPPEYMKDGDIMETEVEGIGTMRNRIVEVRSSK
jgi:2-keto-4-pentenoate hydratase/2-oxohepta-3-ene-1,7-dioic acid hydratase in catechol pathway